MTDIRLYRPPESQRPTRRVIVPRQRVGEFAWKPDTWQERVEAWEWNHPVASAALTLALFLVALIVFVLLGVAAGRP